MSRYIKLADALRTLADTCYLDEIDENMQKLPSIDIVFCDECVEYDDEWCMYWQNVVDVYDFCSYGERKGNE